MTQAGLGHFQLFQEHRDVGDETILKCRFYYYSNMMKPADQMTAIEKMACHSQFPRGAARSRHAGPNGKLWVVREAE